MTSTCCECLESSVSVDDAGVCPPCALRLRLERSFTDGCRMGWHACEAFYGIDRATGEVVSDE